ncbi:MAG: lipopolysaccharide biosynthesis protein [Verrucomicrobiaceae bacterium]
MAEKSTSSVRTMYASWALLASVTVTSLLSLKISFNYISKEELGLWILIRQTIGYLVLLDFGISGSIGRILSKSIHGEEGEGLDRKLSNIRLILIVQVVVIVLLAYIIGGRLDGWFELGDELAGEGRKLLYAVAVAACFRQLFRLQEGYLYAKDKFYLVCTIGAAGAWFELLFQWFFYEQGHGITSLAFAQIVSALFVVALLIYHSNRQDFKGGFSLSLVRLGEMKIILGYSVNMFVIGFFAQVLFISQPLIVGFLHGLEATTRFSINIRSGGFVRLFLARIVESFVPYWQIKYDKGEIKALAADWGSKVQRVLALSLLGGIFLAIGNKIFVRIISEEGIYVSQSFDVWNTVFIITHVWIGMLTYPFILAMHVRTRAVVSAIQVVVALSLAFVFGNAFGSSGVLIGILLGILGTGGIYNMLQSPRCLQESGKWLVITAIKPNLIMISWFIIVMVHHAFTDMSAVKIIIQCVMLLASVALFVLLNKDFALEIYRTLTRRFRKA